MYDEKKSLKNRILKKKDEIGWIVDQNRIVDQNSDKKRWQFGIDYVE